MSRHPGSRVRLHTHLQPPLVRGDGTVQLGLWPQPSAALHGMDAADVALLEALARPCTVAELESLAAAAGAGPQQVRRLLELLVQHRALVRRPATGAHLAVSTPANDVAAAAAAAAYRLDSDGLAEVLQRRRRSVAVLGRGPLADALRRRLGALGAQDATVADPSRPDLLVLVAAEALGPDEVAGWARSGTDHLPVVVHHHRAWVGPLVSPPGGPCLRCCDLARADRDAMWPRLVRQRAVGVRAVPLECADPVEADPALSGLVTGVVGVLVQGVLDDRPPAPGQAWALCLPHPAPVTFCWPVHPCCPHPEPGRGLPRPGSGDHSSTPERRPA